MLRFSSLLLVALVATVLADTFHDELRKRNSCDLGGQATSTASYHLYESDTAGSVACALGHVYTQEGDYQVTAINNPYWNGGARCGECLKVTGPKGSTVVRVIDMGGSKIDLSRTAFEQIGNTAAGKISVSWETTPCEMVKNKKIRYRFKGGSFSGGWMQIQVLDHYLPIDKFEARNKASDPWKALKKNSNNYWLPNGMTLRVPFEVRFTSNGAGQSVTDTINVVYSDESKFLAGNTQFTECGGGSPPPPPPASTSAPVPPPPPASTSAPVPPPPPASTSASVPPPPPASTSASVPPPPPASTSAPVPPPPPPPPSTTYSVPPPTPSTSNPVPPPSPPSPPSPPPTPAVNCPQKRYFKDGYCDPGNNIESCQYDGGDCCEGTCTGGRSYTCGSNGYACVDPAEKKEAPPPPPPSTGEPVCKRQDWYKDGYCDNKNNVAECHYDGGDCCASTCKPGRKYDCGRAGYTCEDPYGNNNGAQQGEVFADKKPAPEILSVPTSSATFVGFSFLTVFALLFVRYI